jgi:hypothetical protein
MKKQFQNPFAMFGPGGIGGLLNNPEMMTNVSQMMQVFNTQFYAYLPVLFQYRIQTFEI